MDLGKEEVVGFGKGGSFRFWERKKLVDLGKEEVVGFGKGRRSG